MIAPFCSVVVPLGATAFAGALRRMTATGMALLAGTVALQAQAIIGTAGGSNQAIVYPTPGIGLPTPTANVVTQPLLGSRPHGVSFYGADQALVSNFGVDTVSVITISTASLLSSITVPGYGGYGTIAVDPTRKFALACGNTNSLYRISAPFAAGASVASIPLTGTIAPYQTQAIVFAPSGRAFVYTTSAINVLDPPYSSVAFTIPAPWNVSSLAIAITSDGNQLLVTDGGTTVRIFTAPFTSSSTPVALAIPGANMTDGIMITPDGTKALVASAAGPLVHAVSSPFTASSTVEQIPLPPAFNGGGFEDVGISADGQLAIVTGNSGPGGACFIQAPFTAAGATVHSVAIVGGRGAGAVRFMPPGLAAGLTLDKTAPAVVDQGGHFTYTISYGNTGSLPANGVIIHETVPAGASFASASNGGTYSNGVVTWNLGNVLSEASGTVSYVANVTGSVGDVIKNTTYTIEGAGIAPIYGPPISSVIGEGYDMIFNDNNHASRLRINRTTGRYSWDCLSGLSSGTSYTGTGILKMSRTDISLADGTKLTFLSDRSRGLSKGKYTPALTVVSGVTAPTIITIGNPYKLDDSSTRY